MMRLQIFLLAVSFGNLTSFIYGLGSNDRDFLASYVTRGGRLSVPPELVKSPAGINLLFDVARSNKIKNQESCHRGVDMLWNSLGCRRVACAALGELSLFSIDMAEKMLRKRIEDRQYVECHKFEIYKKEIRNLKTKELMCCGEGKIPQRGTGSPYRFCNSPLVLPAQRISIHAPLK